MREGGREGGRKGGREGGRGGRGGREGGREGGTQGRVELINTHTEKEPFPSNLENTNHSSIPTVQRKVHNCQQT